MTKRNPLVEARLRKADGLVMSGQTAEAEPLYAGICASDRLNVEAHVKHSEIARRLGLHAKALASAQKARALAPKMPQAHYLEGAALQCLGHVSDSVAAYDRALALDPRMVDALYLKGNALLALNDPRGAIPPLREAIALNPRLFPALSDLGAALIAIEAREEARDVLRRAIALQPDAAEVLCNLSMLEMLIGQRDEALRLSDLAYTLAPEHPAVLASHATMLERAGRLDEAQRVLDQGDLAHTTHVGLLVAAAKVARRQKRLPDACALLERAHALPHAGSENQEICSTLGQLYDQLDDAERAYPLFVEGKRALAQQPQTYAERVRQLGALFGPELDAPSDASVPEAADSPVFLVGFPRSGTTLLEQMLDAHPGLQAIEERPMVSRMGERFLALTAGRERPLQSLSETEIAELRASYFAELALHLQRRPGTLLLDKLPLNIVWVPLLQRVFPQARFILALRHPCDSSLSCFMQNFSLSEAMASFHSMASTAALYHDVMGLWLRCAEALPLKAHPIRYEDLIADQEGQLRALLDFLGLAWDDKVLDHVSHASTRVINTPSYHQVVQPVYRHATHRWQRYRTQIAAELPVLEPFARAFGYPM